MSVSHSSAIASPYSFCAPSKVLFILFFYTTISMIDLSTNYFTNGSFFSVVREIASKFLVWLIWFRVRRSRSIDVFCLNWCILAICIMSIGQLLTFASNCSNTYRTHSFEAQFHYVFSCFHPISSAQPSVRIASGFLDKYSNKTDFSLTPHTLFFLKFNL